MSFTKRIAIISLASIALIVAAIFARRAHQSLSTTNAERSRLRAQTTALTTQIHATEKDLAQAKADWQDELAATTDSDRTAMWANNYAKSHTDRADTEFSLENEPPIVSRFRGQLLLEYVLNIRNVYGPLNAFLEKEHFTPDQTAQLKKALAQRATARQDLGWALVKQGLTFSDPSSHEMQQQIEDTFQQTAEDILGTEGYARIATYLRQNSIWDMMGEYGVAATSIGLPVPREQLAQMVDYISQNNPDYKEGKVVNVDQIDWPSVNDYARTIMTPDQFALFTRLTARDATQQKFDRAVDAITEAARRQNDGDHAPAQ